MKKSVRSLSVAAMLLLTTVQLFSFDEMNRQIGIIYLKNAAAYYLNGNYEQAMNYLHKTSEFYQSSSDYYYLSGLIKLDAENDLNEAVDYFKKSIDNRNWLLLEKRECITDYAQILFRTKKYSELISLIENEGYPDFRDNDLMYLYLLSLRYEGRDAEYSSLLRRSIERYSDDFRFGMLYVNDNFRYRDEVLEGGRFYKNDENAIEVYLEAVMNLEEGDRKLRALEQYFSNGGRETVAFIEYYRLRGGITDEELDKLMESGKVFENPEVKAQLMRILPSISMRTRLEEEYDNYTGNRYYDFNGDGYFEELHLFDNGVPVGMSIDADQDGEIEALMIFENGQPYEVILTGEELITVSYDNYPSIIEISIADESEKNIYTLLKDSLTLEIFEERQIDGKIVFLSENAEKLLSRRDLINKNSVRVASYTGGSKSGDFTYLKHELERRDEKYSILKIYDEIIGNYVYQQYNERRTTGFGDLDYDNLIDLRETYDRGRLSAIEVDDNKNGKFDYKITFDEDYVVSWWDFNEDGVYDCKQYRENDRIVNEYSSRFDGNFDIIERK